MAEYISREAAIKAVEDADAMCDIPADAYRVLMRYVERIPAADVVPVVRCGECEYSKEARVNKNGFLICPASGMEITDHDYCSYGERMDTVTECNHVKGGDGK